MISYTDEIKFTVQNYMILFYMDHMPVGILNQTAILTF